MQRFLVTLAGIAIVVFLFVQFVGSKADVDLSTLVPSETSQPVTPTEAPSVSAEAPAAGEEPAGGIDTIKVTPVQRIPAYDRKAQFTPGGKGQDWPDVDGNGCETRDDILFRDLTNVEKRDACVVVSGTLADPYTGKTIDFVKDIYVDGKKTGGNSMGVQIDHVVSLKAAWEAGAHAWTQEQRIAFANDPANLIASDGPTNGSKNAKSPAEWMPSDAGNASYNCTYATKYTQILVKYDLTASASDLQTLRKTLATC